MAKSLASGPVRLSLGGAPLASSKGEPLVVHAPRIDPEMDGRRALINRLLTERAAMVEAMLSKAVETYGMSRVSLRDQGHDVTGTTLAVVDGAWACGSVKVEMVDDVYRVVSRTFSPPTTTEPQPRLRSE